MKIKTQFTIYNIINLITPIILIGVISVCFVIVFMVKYPVEELNISRASLLSPIIFTQAIGDFIKNHPDAILYVFLWLLICLLILILSSSIITRLMTRSIEKPINSLADAADDIKNGNLSFEVMGSDYDEIDTLCRNFDEMRKALKLAEMREERLRRERSMLIANISHDIKTPVTSIKGYVEGIRDGVAATPEKLTKYLDTIYAKADAIDSMVNNLSDFSKMELSSRDFIFAAGDVNALLRGLIEDYALWLQNNGVKVTARVCEDEAVVRLDSGKMCRALSNIIENAVKYGGDSPEIKIESFMRDEGVYIIVSDNGIGIDEKDLGRVFESFYRADASRSIKGSGLGLGIVKQIIEKHGGKIWLKSDGLGKGTTAVVYLPLMG